MKYIKNFINLLFGKLFVITVTTITIFFSFIFDKYLLLNNRSVFQFWLGITPVLLGILITISSFTSNGIFSTLSKRWKMFNYLCIFWFFIGGLLILNDLKNRPILYEVYDKESTISSTNQSIIVEIPSIENINFTILYCNKNIVKYDSLCPLIVYGCYKVDMFGNKTPSQLCVKSDLMPDYVYLLSK